MSSTNPIDTMRLMIEQRRREGIAKVIPFLSFAFTHMALTAFVCASFFVTNQTTRICFIALGVLLTASEWIYTIVISIQWRRDILARALAESNSRQAIEAAQQTIKEAHIDLERKRWQAEITRRRWQRDARQSTLRQQLL